MQPEIQILGLQISSYGLFLSIAHLAGVALALWLVKREGKPIEPFVDLIFVVVVFTLIGARAGYLLEHGLGLTTLRNWFSLDKGGLSLFGGLLLGFPAYLAMLRWKGLPVWNTSDSLIPVAPFSLALIRFGCFLAGCCHGTPTTLPWGLPLSGDSVPLHPLPLYEAGFLLLLSASLFHLRRKSLPAGFLVCAFLAAYALFRLFTSPLRGDMVPFWGPFSLPQLAAGLLLLASISTLCFRIKAANTPKKS